MDLKEFSQKYYNVLRGTFANINLTRNLGEDDFYIKNILDSLSIVRETQFFEEKLKECGLLVDVGFGGGFPLLPLAHHYPQYKFIGLEARQKKASAVSEIIKLLNLNNVRVYHLRSDEVYWDRSTVVTFRAVSGCKDSLAQISTDKKIYPYFFKGPNFESQEDKDFASIEKSWETLEKVKFSLEKDLNRTIIGLENKIVPCGTYKMNQGNLKLLSAHANF